MAEDSKAYEVGYGKPPKNTQFVKGQSGNAKGRPKGARNILTMLRKVGRQTVMVNTGGRTVRMSKLEACLHQLANGAANGDLRSIRELLHWITVLTEQEPESTPVPALDANEKLVIKSILKRLRQSDSTETRADEPEGDSSEPGGKE
jgi:hypothetical protein